MSRLLLQVCTGLLALIPIATGIVSMLGVREGRSTIHLLAIPAYPVRSHTVIGGTLMQLALTEPETEILRDLLLAYLPELEREISRTERHTLRHVLVQRQELAERLLEELGAATS